MDSREAIVFIRRQQRQRWEFGGGHKTSMRLGSGTTRSFTPRMASFSESINGGAVYGLMVVLWD